MKSISTVLSYALSERHLRQNLRALGKVLLLQVVVIAVFTVLFHFIMLYEGKEHSYITGLYWVLTVMSTLGFGDITFTSDLGRAFSVLVLIVGIFLLLIVLPFAFIRYAYAPWLDAQLKATAPRELPVDTKDHILICSHDIISQHLANRLTLLGVPYWVIEPDAKDAALLCADEISTMTGERDAKSTYDAARVQNARLVFANLEDRVNTNITLTVRESSATVPILALADDKDAIDILELSGATQVVPLKHRLGEHLAARVSVGTPHVHIIGHYGELAFGEFPLHRTSLAGKTVAEAKLRQRSGVNLIALWERGRVRAVTPDLVLTDKMVAVVSGRDVQMRQLDTIFDSTEAVDAPILVIGGGKVGRSATRALKKRGLEVNIIEMDRGLEPVLEEIADRVFIGNAAERRVISGAGIEQASSVVITCNDDATNVYLAAYCRRLAPNAKVVSRITHERNLEAIHRAGADFVLSYATLGMEVFMSALQKRELLVLGEGMDIVVERMPKGLVGKTLAEARISDRTGLTVVAIRDGDKMNVSLAADVPMRANTHLVMFGVADQLEAFRKHYAEPSK